MFDDPELLGIVALSLRVSLTALVLSSLIGLPLGAWLGLKRLRLEYVVLAVVYTGMALPPVVVGLFVYVLLSQRGAFGFLQWLFTPAAMIAAQTIIATPVIIGLVMLAVMGVNPDLRRQLISLGATETQATLSVLNEARFGVLTALVAGFGRLISEVGAVMLVGGNVQGATRVLTTSIVLETRQGDFDRALALGVILLVIALVINTAVLILQRRDLRHALPTA